MSEAENSDRELRAKLHSMWTSERFHQFEVWLRELFREKADPAFWGKLTEEEREKMILELKQRAIEKHRQLAQLLAPLWEAKVMVDEEFRAGDEDRL
jgi:hypothetical protein